MPQAHKPAEVVRPLIWLLELNKIEFPLIIAIEITEAAEITGKPCSVFAKMQRSIIAATDDASEIIIKVLSPAECLLLERSQPINAERATTRQILKTTE